ncbi:hypothetical protein F4824DRAFT_511762 [Ustulina deusta]|nr:hypothetical protein F4824DRAFT_511762 [Ustulina deusta]
MRANIQSSSYRGYSSGRASYPVDVGQITGTLHYGESLREARSVENLCNSEECLMAEFNCSLAAAYSDFNPGWESSLCTADVIGGGYWHGNYSLGWDLGTEPWSNQSLVYLLFSTNMYTSDWQTSRESRSLDNAPRTAIGEWSSYEIQDNRFINVTLCFSSIHANLTSVDMTATGNLVEPVGNWSATGFGNSSEVRKYLGASEDPATPADRGILTITHIKAPDNLSPWEPYDEDSEQPNQTLAELGGSQFEEAIYRALAGYDTPNATFQACSLCEFEGLGQHPELAAIIQDTIGETGRAADALQAYTTSVGNTFHQYFLKAFNGTEEVHIAFIKTVQVAGACHENGCKGLISVASLLALHLLCVALTTYRYVRLTRYSRQGNAWHAVSQLTGPELEAAVRRGNDMCDDALVKELKGEKGDVFVTLRKMDSGRIDIVESVEKSKNIQQ